MDFSSPVKWNGIEISERELTELNSLAVRIYTDKATSREAAWIEAMLTLLNKKGYLKLPA